VFAHVVQLGSMHERGHWLRTLDERVGYPRCLQQSLAANAQPQLLPGQILKFLREATQTFMLEFATLEKLPRPCRARGAVAGASRGT
jgi:hypothetical protein